MNFHPIILIRLKKDGTISPLTERRPLRILRVYKRNLGVQTKQAFPILN